MKKDQLSEDAQIYVDYYPVIQYVLNELAPAAAADIEGKLDSALEETRKELEKAGFKTWREGWYLAVYPGAEWYDVPNGGPDVAVFARLNPEFRDTSGPRSRIGVTAFQHDGALKVLKQAKKDDVEWMQGLSEAHGKQQSEQYFKNVDWFDKFDTFADVATGVASELRDLATALAALLKAKAVTP